MPSARFVFDLDGPQRAGRRPQIERNRDERCGADLLNPVALRALAL